MSFKNNSELPAGVKVVEFSLYITKAYFDEKSGKNRWVATCSNTQKDAFDTHMTVELFRDFLHRIEIKEQAPEQFRSQYWSGGLPYLSIAHYEDLGGWASAGETEVLYVDGEYLKAKGFFLDTEVGRALYKTISEELEQRPENPVRISIAFLDYGHKHGLIEWERKSLMDVCPMCREGLGDIHFTKGLLVHLATTRIPANEDTGIGLEERSMDPITRKDDAESMVGEELAKKLEKESLLVGKSMAKAEVPALVVRAEGDNSTTATTPSPELVVEEKAPEVVEERMEAAMADVPGGSMPSVAESIDYPLGGAVSLTGAEEYLAATNQVALAASLWTYVEDCLYNILERPDVEDKKSAVAKLMAEFSAECKKLDGEKMETKSLSDPADESLAAFRTRLVEIRGSPQIVAPEDKLRALQEDFVAFGEAVKKSFMQPEDEIVEEPPEIQRYIEPLRQENADLRSKVESLENSIRALQIGKPPVTETRKVAPENPVIPQRRSYVAPPVKVGVKVERKLLSVRQIVRRNMGLSING